MEAYSMIYDTAAIVGLGLMGGSLAGALKKYKVCNTIIGITRSDAYIRAQKIGLIDRGFPLDRLKEGVQDADIVILAMPVKHIISLLPKVIPFVKNGCTITDVGSTKTSIIHEAQSHQKSGIYFIGGHPMAGSEKTGFEAGDPDLFANRPYALVYGDEVPEIHIEKYCTMIRKIGAIPVELSAETHDHIVSGTSHLPQLAALALMNIIGRKNDQDSRFFVVNGPVFEEMTRVAGSPYSMWEDILLSNETNIYEMLSEFIRELEYLQKNINDSKMEEYFTRANRYRKILLTAKRDRLC